MYRRLVGGGVVKPVNCCMSCHACCQGRHPYQQAWRYFSQHIHSHLPISGLTWQLGTVAATLQSPQYFSKKYTVQDMCHQGCEIKEFSWKRCVCSCLVGCLPTHLLTASICRRLLQALHTVPDKIHITHTCTHHSYNILKYTFIWTRLRGNDLTWHLFVVHS